MKIFNKNVISIRRYMEEIYKGIKISYVEVRSHFKFEICDTTLMISTLDYAKRTIDNYYRSKELIGKKVIGFRISDGMKIVAEIAKLSVDELRIVHTSPIGIHYIDKEDVELSTMGPLIEYNEENEEIANKITSARLTIKDTYKRIDELHLLVNSRRIDRSL
jgi:hypothetical protein